MCFTLSDFMTWLAGMFCPPLAVFLITGEFGEDFWINLGLTLLAYTPGHIHLFYVNYIYKWEPRFQRWGRALQVNRFSTKGKTASAPSASFSSLEKPDELGPGEARPPSRGPSPGPDKVYIKRPNPGPSS